MLKDRSVAFRFREYTEDPLSEAEIRRVLDLLGVEPKQVLRKRDRVYRELGLSGDEHDDELIRLMATHPTLLERPIGVVGPRAVIGRPPELLLELVTE